MTRPGTVVRILVVTVLALFALQVFSTNFGNLSYSTAANPSSPGLSQITLTSYNGVDSSAIADLQAGKIASYDYALTSTEQSELSSSFGTLSVPYALYDVLVNPTNTTFGFNPFQFTQVRQALNYIVDRSYFVSSSTLLDGNGIAGITPYSGEPDTLTVSNVTAQYAGYYNYSIPEANATIYPVLHAAGATLSSGKWMYQGSPITVYVFQRTDDVVRETYAGFLANQLTTLGFTVSIKQGDLSVQNSLIYGSDPVNATWDLAVEQWGGVYGYYDESLLATFTGAIGELPPYSDSNGLAMGEFNDSAYENASLISTSNQADQIDESLLSGNFNNTAQRASLLENLTALSFQLSTRIWLATSLAAYAYNPSLVSNITPNFVESPVLNTISYLTMTSSTGKVDIGVRYLNQGSSNPFQGFQDLYSVDLAAGVVLPLFYYQPSTGYPYLIGINTQLNSISDTANIAVPSSALYYNYTTGDFANVPAGTDAKTVVTANFAPLFNNDKWDDGQPITLADMLYQYVVAENATFNTNSPIYDSANGIYAPDLSTVLGFNIVNSTTLQIYSSYFYPDSNFAVYNAVTDMFPLGYALPGGNMFPWQLYQAMSNVVASGKAAWDEATAQSEGIDWLSLVSPTDVASIDTALSNYASTSYVPAQFTQLAKLTGITLVNASSAASGYTAETSFISTNGNALISDGPFYVSAYQTTNTPNYAILTKNPYFNAGAVFPPQLFAQATSITTDGTSIPSVLTQGGTFTVTTLSTVIGSNHSVPQAGVNAVAQFVSNNAVVLQETATSVSGGTATFNIPSSLATGTYSLTVYSSSSNSSLINPYQTSVTVVSSTASSATTTSTGSSTATTTTTSSNTTLYVIAAVVVVIVVIGVVFAMRRRPAAQPAPAQPPPATPSTS